MLKRASFLAYGVACYLVFFVTFVYAIGFVGGFAVPTLLDGPAVAPTGLNLAIDAALLGLFAVQHSLMARRWFKEWWTRLVPAPLERSTYVLASSLALILLFVFWQPLGGIVWLVEGTGGRTAFYLFYAFGWGLLLACTFLINHFDLFGLRQVWLYATGRPYTSLRFTTPGPYRLVRHPLYVGWLFIFWMTPTMTLSHLLFALGTTAYIVLAIQFEEADLIQEHGQAYRDYRRKVPMLWPLPRPAAADDREPEDRALPA